jgi:hypothetical protein
MRGQRFDSASRTLETADLAVLHDDREQLVV